MATKRTTGEKEGTGVVRVKIQYVLERRHVQALRGEAFKRAQERGAGQPGASEVLREVLDGWMKRRAR